MNLKKKFIATMLSAAMLFSVMVPASVSATDKPVVNHNKTVAGEKSKATVTVNESTVSRVEKSASQPSKAGKLINDIKDTATYEEALRTVLDNYYSNGNPENAERLDSVVDSRGDEIFENYINAENERKTKPEELGFMPGEVLAVTKAGVNDEDIPDLINDERMSVTAVLPYSQNRKLIKIAISLEDTVDNAIAKLESDENIEFIEKDQVYTNDYVLSDYIDDTEHENLYHLNLIKSVEAWKLIAESDHEKIKVAVIDTGIDIEHEDLKNVINKDLSVRVSGDGFISPLKNDNGTHRTHVGGIISAEANNNVGIAGAGSAIDNSAIDLIGIGSDTGDGSSFSTFTVYRAIKYAVENGVRVINLSLGGSSDPNNIFSNAVELAVNSGCVVVCAAGNENSTALNYPSDCEGAISVIALDEAGEKRADFSNYGGNTNKISAPGSPVYSSTPDNCYESKAGTSMASPVVAAVAGMVLSVNPELTADDVKDILYSSTDDLSVIGYDDETGYGRVNAYKAVKQALEYNTDNSPASLRLSNSKLELAKGATTKIKGTVYPESAVQTIGFHSKNEGVATVSSDGTVTAKASGTTEIVVSTANNISAKCTVTVKDNSTSTLSTPTAEAIQTGISTGAVLSWEKVENAEYYQVYSCDTENGNYSYSGSTTNTYYSIETESVYDKPANTVLFFRIKAVTSNNNISDSEFSDSVAYVYTGKSPYFSAEIISSQGFGKGVLLHWSTIVSSELYRTSSEDNKPVLIQTFYDAVSDNSYYDNKGELKEGVTYTYTLKPFNTYKGVKYYGTESTLTLEYHEDDPVVENCDEPRINAVTFQDNILYLSTYNSPQHTLGRIYASDDNGETWFTTCNFFTGNTEYTYWSQNINLEPERKYLFRYKFYEHDYLFGLYRTASKYSNIVSVTTPRNPVKPQLSIKSSAGTLPELSWTGESVENGYYTVYRRNQGSGFWVTIGTEIKSYQYTDTTADKDKIYYYKVVYTNPSPEFIIESDCNLATVVRNLNSEDSNSVSFRTDKIIKDICTADFSEVKDIVYSDNMTLPEITVTYKGIKLQENVDYIVSSSNYDKAGRAKIVISGIGEYSGEKAIYYNITLPETEKPLTYTVKYLDYDGTAISIQNVQPHSDSVVPPAPLRSGYIFVGWSHNGKNITADTDIKAKYKKSDSKLYTVTFVDRENNVISSQKIAFGESANAPQAPEFEGYKFDSWSGNYTSVSNNMLVKAKYKATSFESGTGTEDNPYIIASQEQLDYFSYVINNKNAEYSTACYKLANDIYYNDITSFESWSQNAVTGVMYYPENIWEPAGIKSENSSYSNSFKGNFDGNGYAIYGLYVNTKKDYVGFIGSAENAVITDLGIEKSFFATKGDYAGALVGLFSSMTDESEIYCCYGKDNYIKANGNAGGFAGQIMSISSRSAITITNCYSTDSYLEITDDLYLGGFSGFIRSNGTINIERCYTNNALTTEAPNPKLGLFSGDISKSDSATIMIGFSYCFQTMILDNYYSQYPPLGTPIDTVVISQVSLDYFNDKNCLLELKDYTTKENLRYDKNAVWVFSENDFPRLYTEGGKYTIEMHLGSKPFYVAVLREGDKVKVPFVNVDYGYTATGWTGEIPETMPANDILLFNHVQENSYTVDFYVDDIFVESKTYYQNDEIEIPMAPDGGEEIIWRDLPPVMPNENIKVYGYTPALGDVNCDGDINILDVIIAMKGVVDLSVLDSAQKVNADVNLDGVLNVVDVIMIQKFIIGEISSLQ